MTECFLPCHVQLPQRKRTRTQEGSRCGSDLLFCKQFCIFISQLLSIQHEQCGDKRAIRTSVTRISTQLRTLARKCAHQHANERIGMLTRANACMGKKARVPQHALAFACYQHANACIIRLVRKCAHQYLHVHVSTYNIFCKKIAPPCKPHLSSYACSF